MSGRDRDDPEGRAQGDGEGLAIERWQPVKPDRQPREPQDLADLNPELAELLTRAAYSPIVRRARRKRRAASVDFGMDEAAARAAADVPPGWQPEDDPLVDGELPEYHLVAVSADVHERAVAELDEARVKLAEIESDLRSKAADYAVEDEGMAEISYARFLLRDWFSEQEHEMLPDAGSGRCLQCGKRWGSDEHPVPPEVEEAVARNRAQRRATGRPRDVTP